MSFWNTSDQEQYNFATASPGATEIRPDGFFSGLPKGVMQSIGGAGVSVGQTLLDMANFVNDTNLLGTAPGRSTATSFSNFKESSPSARSELSKSIQSALDDAHAWTKLDPREAGQGTQIVGGIARGITLGTVGFGLGGPLGAAGMLGGVEGDTAYHDAKAQGLDDNTAMTLAGVQGAFNAAGAFLPMHSGASGLQGMAMSILKGAGINVTVGAANRYATSSVLEANGYHDMARQYQVGDANAIAADAVLGAAFGAMGKYFDRPSPEQVKGAIDGITAEHVDRSAPGIPSTPLAAAAHNEEFGNAVASLDRGVLPQVDPANAEVLARETLKDPAQEALRKQAIAGLDAEMPGAQDFAKPVDVPEKAWTPPEQTAETAAKPPLAAGEPTGPALSSQSRELLSQLVQSHPNLEITLDDGRVVRAADLPQMFEQQTADARRLAVLHDVAAACFMGTE